MSGYQIYLSKDKNEIKELLSIWQYFVEPFFLKKYQHLQQSKFWRVQHIYRLFSLFSRFQDLEFVFIINEDEEDSTTMIIGIGLIARQFPCRCKEDIKEFLWYVLKNPNVKFKGLVELIIQHACNDNYIWLHADPKGGEQLLTIYKNIGFNECPCKKGQFVSMLRRHDGRYLYLKLA